jgi:adenylate cyclase
MSAAGEVACYRFDGFSLDLVRGGLVTATGVEVPLRHKSYRLLRLFLENANRLLDRDMISQAIWPGVSVADDGISQCVRDIRRALGDHSQTRVRAVPHRGYIFTADVTVVCDETRSGHGLMRIDRPAIAVLPFVNMSGDPDQEHLADGVAETITTELARNRSLLVIARTSSFTYKGRAVEIKQVARELGVAYVLEGSVKRSRETLRVTAQLIDAANSGHVWAGRYDRNLADLFATQDEVAREVVTAIDPEILRLERHRAWQKPWQSLTAWEAWQRALSHWARGNDVASRLQCIHRALELDPDLAPAHAMLVRLYLSEGTRGVGRPLKECLALAEAEARTALDLDPHSSIVRSAYAWLLNHQGNRGAALEQADIAIALNQNDSQGHLIRGHALIMEGEHGQAQDSLAMALRLDPRGPTGPAVMHNRAVGYYLGRDYASADAVTRESIRKYPTHPRAYLWRAAVLGQLGSPDAKTALEDAISVGRGYFEYKIGGRSPYVGPTDHEHLLDGLRKAGWRGLIPHASCTGKDDRQVPAPSA